MVQHVKPLFATSASLINMGLSPGCSVSDCFPAGEPGKVAKDGPGTWVPAATWEIHVEFVAPIFGLVQA